MVFTSVRVYIVYDNSEYVLIMYIVISTTHMYNTIIGI